MSPNGCFMRIAFDGTYAAKSDRGFICKENEEFNWKNKISEQELTLSSIKYL
jgi:hypothetical protein